MVSSDGGRAFEHDLDIIAWPEPGPDKDGGCHGDCQPEGDLEAPLATAVAEVQVTAVTVCITPAKARLQQVATTQSQL